MMNDESVVYEGFLDFEDLVFEIKFYLDEVVF